MNRSDQELIVENMQNNSELKQLWTEHLKFEQRLKKIDKKPFLNPEEKIEKKRLQIAKLAGKTRIENIISQYR